LPIKEEDTGLYSWDSNLSYYSNLCPVQKRETSNLKFLNKFLINLFIREKNELNE
jgi:hypothetical protein